MKLAQQALDELACRVLDKRTTLGHKKTNFFVITSTILDRF